MSHQLARNMLVEQRRRMVGSLMNFMETEVYPLLDPKEQRALRSKVIGATSQYHDVCLDLLKSAVPDGTVGNDAALEQLASQVAGLRRDLRTDVRTG